MNELARFNTKHLTNLFCHLGDVFPMTENESSTFTAITTLEIPV